MFLGKNIIVRNGMYEKSIESFNGVCLYIYVGGM